jgi:hypothetical protein
MSMHTHLWAAIGLLLVATAAISVAAVDVSATRPTGPGEAMDTFLRSLTAADQTELTRRIAATNADEEMLRTTLGAACREVGAFGVAMTDRFAAGAAGKWGVGAAAATAEPVREAADAAVVRVTAAGAARDVELIRQGGVWKLTYAGVAEVLRQRQVEPLLPIDEPLRRLVDVAEAMKVVTAAIRKGEYATADAAAEAGRKAWTEAARGANTQ